MSRALPRTIPTFYEGYNFRTRLEARWAVFFDHLGVQWDYESEGYELGNGLRYLPDFWLPNNNMWLDVKPGPADAMALEKARRLVAKSASPLFLANGMPDNQGTYFSPRESSINFAILLPRFSLSDYQAAVLAARGARFGDCK